MSYIISEDFPEIVPEKQYPKDQKICSTQQWKQNWKCIALTVSILLSITSAYWCHRELSNQGLSKKEIRFNENTRWVLILTTIILYSLYLMECSHASDSMQLCGSRTENIRSVIDKVNDMKNALPVIWWKAICYHYERRKRRTTQYRRGTYFVATRIYQERVNTVSASSSFNYTCCGQKDISNLLVINRNCRPIIKFRFSKGFAFANMAAATEFEAQRSAFFQELQRYDDYMEVHEGLDLTDYASFQEEKIVLNTTTGRRPWFANPFYYWSFSCILLSYPFRMILLRNTTHVHYKITKLFGADYGSNNNNNNNSEADSEYNPYRYPDDELTPLSPGAGNDDDSMAIDLVSNLIIAPSYSEAMLLDNGRNRTSIEIVASRDYSNSILSIDGGTASYFGKTIIIANDGNSDNDNDPRNDSSDQIANGTSNASGLTSDDGNANISRRLVHRDSCPVAAATIVVMNEDQPPAYEDALMLPVVPRAAVECSREETELLTTVDEDADCRIISRTSTPSHNPYDLRLPNSRAFLSIETSL